MGLFGEVRREFIARPDASKGQILYKWPDTNIRKWTQLTVEQDEVAVFFRDGRVQGTVNPGRATLDSSEIPFLGMLVDAGSGGNLFKTEIYFISTHEFPGLPFGGMVDNVVDPETGLAIGLRVFGEYSLRVVEPQSLIVNLVGTQNVQTNDQITDWMRQQLLKIIRTDVTAHITREGWPILGIAAHTDDVEAAVLDKVQAYIVNYGLQIPRLGNLTISIKEEDEETLKRYRKDIQYTRLAGGFQQYSVGQAYQGIGEGAAQGGGAGNPAILGIGLGLGGAAAGIPGSAGAGSAPAPVQVRCGRCGTLNPESARFCSSCAAPLGSATSPASGVATCASCGSPLPPGARFCANCGAAAVPVAPAVCAGCGAALPPGARFCAACGTPVVAAPQTVACPSCATRSPAGTRFCPACGTSLAADSPASGGPAPESGSPPAQG